MSRSSIHRPLHEDQQSEQDAEREDGRRRGLLRRHPFAFSIGLLLLIPIAAVGYLYWDQSRNFELTDDAFIDAPVSSHRCQVTGAITAVPVTDNQLVATGALLVGTSTRAIIRARSTRPGPRSIKPRPTVANFDAQIDAQKARVIDQAGETGRPDAGGAYLRQQENERNQDLMRNNAGTRQQLQQAASNFIQGRPMWRAPRPIPVATQKQIPILERRKRQGAVAPELEPDAVAASAGGNGTLAAARTSRRSKPDAPPVSAAVGGNLPSPGRC